VFSTWFYTGNGATQTITNGIDLSGKGGLVWAKSRNQTVYYGLSGPDFATSYVGGYGGLRSNQPAALGGTDFTGVTSTGFTLSYLNGDMNFTGGNYVSWTFRKQPKFFDVVTYTGTGANRTISHNLGSVPGCVIVKSVAVGNVGYDWRVYHNGLTSAAYTIQLNAISAQSSQPSIWNSTAPTSSVFSVGTDISVNEAGNTYVAYLFAHNAGGFGLTGTDNVISCGSYAGNGSATGPVITLGYEPQWVLVKCINAGANWVIEDVMRGMSYTTAQLLYPNVADAEATSATGIIVPNATGFSLNAATSPVNANGSNYIYIAIRRGPMKVPTVGTSVFSPVTYVGDDTPNRVLSVGFVPDAALFKNIKAGFADYNGLYDRLRGNGNLLKTNTTETEYGVSTTVSFTQSQNAVVLPSAASNGWNYNGGAGYEYIMETFSRAPGFFDVVCYTGNGTSALAVTHNLQAVPQLIITKQRNDVRRWQVYSVTTGASAYLVLNTTAASFASSSMWNATTPTSTTFTVGDIGDNNVSGGTYVAYLFATCPGVSKVGLYTGTGATQTIDCGFTGGARFVLIKRTDTTGDWYVWDTARGMVPGTDPSLLLNSTAAEVNANSIYTTGVGFQIVSTDAGINASGGTYIFLAVA
jgi:hypothetical protein